MGYDPELGWRLLPDVEKRGPFWGVDEPARTNSRGWRDAEHPLAKPPGVRRIVALGDSFTCLLYTSPSPRDQRGSRMPSSA